MTDEATAPTIQIDGHELVAIPNMTKRDALANYEELARKYDCGLDDRIRFAQSIVMAAKLAGLAKDLTLDQMVSNFEGLTKNCKVEYDLMMALISSVKVVRGMANDEKARLAEEGEPAKEGGAADGAGEANEGATQGAAGAAEAT